MQKDKFMENKWMRNELASYKRLRNCGKCLATLLILPAAAPLAQEHDGLIYNWYLNANAGFAKSRASAEDINRQFQQVGLDATVTKFDDTDIGYGLALGYQWHKNWAVEAGVRNLGEFAIDITAASDNSAALYNTIENLHPESAKGIFAALNYRFLLRENWSASAKLGVLSWRGDYDTHLIDTNTPQVGSEKQTGTDIFFGIAGAYHWTPRWESQIGWERYQFENHDVDYVHIGLLYRFGERTRHTPASPIEQTSPAPQAPLPATIEKLNKEECQLFSGSLEGLNFASNSAELTTAAKERLHTAVIALQKHSSVEIQIQAHTDSLGTDEANRVLSEARANAVRDFFIQQEIDAKRLMAKGFGEAFPLQDNDTPTGRAINRRVELKLLNQAVCDMP